MSAITGSFVWYELITDDIEAASTFYAKVVGWDIEDADSQAESYKFAKAGHTRVAGLASRPDGSEGSGMWLGYVRVTDVDVTAERVREMGGKLHGDIVDIPGIGRFAIVADPQGARFAILSSAGDAAAQPAADVRGRFGWHELHTTDWKAAFSFYQDLFGWEEALANDMGPMGVYQTFSAAGTWTGGMMGGSPQPHWLYYIEVDDIDAAATRVVEAGGQVLHGPLQVPGGSWVVMGSDPQAIGFALTGARHT